MNGKYGELITTDDPGGVKHEKIPDIINDIRADSLKATGDGIYSGHHYRLYA
jgi:hypothetical protein